MIKKIFFLIFVIILSNSNILHATSMEEVHDIYQKKWDLKGTSLQTTSCDIFTDAAKQLYKKKTQPFRFFEKKSTFLRFKIDTSILMPPYDSPTENKEIVNELKTLKNIGNSGNKRLWRDNNNNILISYTSNKIMKKFLVVPNMTVRSINGKLVANLSDEEIRNATKRDKKVALEVYDHTTLDNNILNKDTKFINVTIEPLSHLVSYLGIKLTQKLISQIDAKNSQHTANIQLHSTITIFPNTTNDSLKLMKLIAQGISESYTFAPKFLACGMGEKDFLALNMHYPEIDIENLVNSEAKANATVKYFLNFSTIKLTDSQIKKGFVDYNVLNIDKVVDYKGAIFKGNYNFQAFPFDSQYLDYNLIVAANGFDIFPYPSSNDSLKRGYGNTSGEWSKSQFFDYRYNIVVEQDYYNPVLTLITKFERNSFYYIFKIFLPILIILFVSWAVFWIKPKDVESRLTVSVVCLLSLIAYTFIIDENIPKLSYLTIMDYTILVSYFFSTIPTLQTIYISQFLPKNEAKSIKINNMFKRYTPLVYLIIFIAIFISVISNSSNVVDALSVTW